MKLIKFGDRLWIDPAQVVAIESHEVSIAPHIRTLVYVQGGYSFSVKMTHDEAVQLVLEAVP